MPSILAFAGSSRNASFNRKLIVIAARAAEEAGAEVTLVELGDFPMPIYNGDLEASAGLPEHARRFKRMLLEHDGLLISSPEYNGAFTPLLKNALDWASRSEPSDAAPLVAYKGKVAAIMSASPGRLGGLRGLVHLRMLLNNLGVMVLPGQHAVSGARDAFDDKGGLKDESQRARIERLSGDLVRALNKLGSDGP